MDVTTQNTANWNKGQKHTSVLALLGLVLLLCCTIGYVCVVRYEQETKVILSEQAEYFHTQAERRAQNFSLWLADLGDQIKRVSSSELFRLFASEASFMDTRTTALLNEAENTTADISEDISVLAEQIPLMRNVMLDFMNYSGFLDTRLVNSKGQTLLSAISRPTPIDAAQQAAVAEALSRSSIYYAPLRLSVAGLVLDVIDPLASILADGESQTEEPVAGLLVTVPASGQLARSLMLDPRQSTTFIPQLLQKTPTGFALVHAADVLPVNTTALNFDSNNTLPFGKRENLTANGEVYSYGLPTDVADMWVIIELPAEAIESQLNTAAIQIFGTGFVTVIGLALLLALLWHIVVGRQQKAVADHFQQLYALINRQKNLLDSVNLSLDVALFMSDTEGNIQVCNRAFADLIDDDEQIIPGTNLARHMPVEVFNKLLTAIKKVDETRSGQSLELIWPDEANEERLFRVNLYLFNDEQTQQQGAVGTISDITEFRRRSQRQQLQQQSLIAAFTRSVEGVDPYLAGHSRKMGDLAQLVAQQLHLSEADVNTLRLATALSQVGKLFVPRELLTKNGKLTQEEQQEMTRVPEYTKELLKDIDFGLPVVDSIYEMYENMDGSGYPQKLSGEQISLHARILAVTNVFCAMVSPRSYREGLAFAEAITQLQSMPNRYDQHVVGALKSVLETPDGASIVIRQD